MCLTDSWLAADGTTELPNYDSTNNINIAIINADNTDDWVYDSFDYCYYYKEELGPNESTSSPIKSVTYNPEYTGSVECTTESGTGDLVCTSTDTGYDGATYTLTLTAETIQSEGLSEWGIGYSINGSDYSLPDAGSAQTTSGYNPFLRNSLTSLGIVPEVGFTYNNNTYYVGPANTYEQNKAILDSAFGASNCGAVSGTSGDALDYGFTGYNCSCEDFEVDLSIEGEISITHYKTNGNFTCEIYLGIACYEEKRVYSALGGDEPVLYETANEAMEAEGHLNYLRYITGRNPSTSVGFKLNNQEYYLIGGDNGDSYSINKATLDSAFGASNCQEVLDKREYFYRCNNEVIHAVVHDYGDIYTQEQNHDKNWECTIDTNGYSECKFSDILIEEG